MGIKDADRILGVIKGKLTQAPRPASAVHVAALYISGLRVSHKEQRIKTHFILPLEPGSLQPSYSGVNIKDRALVEKKIRKGMDMLGANGKNITLLLPDSCQRTFVFSFDSFPKSKQEREQFIQYRIKKQMPMLAENSRLSFVVVETMGRMRVVATIAKNSVINEYEELFTQCGLRVGVIGVPILGIYNLGGWPEDKNVLLLNVEENSLSLLAVVNGYLVLSRQKSSLLPPGEKMSPEVQIRNIAQEIDTTVNFIEDHEQQRIDEVHLRLGMTEGKNSIIHALKETLSLRVDEAGAGLDVSLSEEDRTILIPLIGQAL